MTLWNNDMELFEIARKELFTALVGDILDKLGYLHQFLSPNIKPLRSDMVTIGRAMTVLEADVFEESVEDTKNPMMKKPFGIMFEALDRNELDASTGNIYESISIMARRAVQINEDIKRI